MLDHLHSIANVRVAVIGDVMLDCYLAGDVTRISPEAPVPVVRVKSQRGVPGGAANVCANLASIGADAALVGMTGADATREELIEALNALGHVDCGGMIAIPGRTTTRKLRIIGAHQQIARVDHEDPLPCSPEMERRLIEAALAAIVDADAAIVSDYGKGVCSDAMLRAVIDGAAAAGKPLLIDPKRQDFSVYRGATILTPNRQELTEATRLPCETDEEALLAVKRAQEISGCAILLTRSEKGMSFFPMDAPPIHLATVAQDVFDVSGAGDTVVAMLAACLAAEIPLLDAMRIANHAAGIVVSKVGTAQVTLDELSAALLSDRALPETGDGRLLDRETAVALRRTWERQKFTVGVANGCFDLIHPGHIALLRQAAGSCDRLIVALNTDASVTRLKEPGRPIQNEIARATVIGAIKGVAAVVLFDEDTPLELLRALQPDVLIKGADYTIDAVVGADVVHARGGRVVLAELEPGQSTSALVAASAGGRS